MPSSRRPERPGSDRVRLDGDQLDRPGRPPTGERAGRIAEGQRMGGTAGAMRDPGTRRAEPPTAAHRPEDRAGSWAGRPFEIPSLSRIKSKLHFARRWHELHPEIPLIPLRRLPPGPEATGLPEGRALWLPPAGWGDAPPEGRELARLLKADPSLGIGLRLGRQSPGMPWFVDILVRNVKQAGPALARMLDRHDRARTASWRDEEGTHRIFVGDDRLARFGPLVVGSFRDNGGNPHYPAIEIRIGSAEPGTSFVVLPPIPLKNGGPRWRSRGDAILPVDDRLLADLAGFVGSTIAGADESPASSTSPGGDSHREHAIAEPKATGTVIALRGPEDRMACDTALIEPPDREAPGPESPADLSALAAGINRSHRGCRSGVSSALRHARRAGEQLEHAKSRLGHGEFQAWVKAHCEFAYRTAAGYMEVSRGWPEIEGLLGQKCNGMHI